MQNHNIDGMLDMTVKLLEIVEQAEKQYDFRRETKEKGDFYTEVKPFADNAHQISKQWGIEVTAFLIEHPQKNLHQNQVKATVENIELLTVQCFFPATSYNRFKSYVQSSFFVIEQIHDIFKVT